MFLVKATLIGALLIVLTQCLADVAIIVPYRDRVRHLATLKERWMALLNSTNYHAHVFIAEQNDTAEFNRGRMRNIGATEAIMYGKIHNVPFTHLAFEDVDNWPKAVALNLTMQIPEPKTLLHIYEVRPWVNALWTIGVDDWLTTNGFPNDFYTWGNEDTVMKRRILQQNITVKYPHCDSLWKSCREHYLDFDLHHARDTTKDNREKLKDWQLNPTGLSDLQYTVDHATHEEVIPNILHFHHTWVR